MKKIKGNEIEIYKNEWRISLGRIYEFVECEFL